MKAIRLVIILASLALLRGATSYAAPSTMEDVKYQRAFDAAVDKGLAFLSKSQAKDGSIGDPKTPAITSLAVMAFLARGYTPGLPPYGDVINRGIDYILSIASTNGNLMGSGNMYSHTISTLMLSEVSGMVDPGRQVHVDRALARALRVILTAQAVKKSDDQTGGWRYTPSSSDSDISHVGWALMALRSARNNGAPVPLESIQLATKFIMRCRHRSGGFAYQPGGKAGLARTGIGLLCLELTGRHRDAVTLKAGQYITMRFKSGNPLQREMKYYSLYYAANGMFQLGGGEWEAFAPVLFDTILKLQTADGSWVGEGSEKDPQYCTSMAVLALDVAYCQLPIYQR